MSHRHGRGGQRADLSGRLGGKAGRGVDGGGGGGGGGGTLSLARVLLMPSSPSQVYRFLALRTTTSTPSSTLTISYILLRSTPADQVRPGVRTRTGEGQRGRTDKRLVYVRSQLVCEFVR